MTTRDFDLVPHVITAQALVQKRGNAKARDAVVLAGRRECVGDPATCSWLAVGSGGAIREGTQLYICAVGHDLGSFRLKKRRRANAGGSHNEWAVKPLLRRSVACHLRGLLYH
jgi:hypothetical protein